MRVNGSIKSIAMCCTNMTSEDDSVGDKSCVLLTLDTEFVVLNLDSMKIP